MAQERNRGGRRQRTPVRAPSVGPGDGAAGSSAGASRSSRIARHSAKSTRRSGGRGASRLSGPGKHGRHSRRKTGVPSVSARRGHGRTIVGILVVVALIAVASAAVGRYLLYHPAAEVAAGQPVRVTIEQGATTAEIADMLAAAGVVDNALMFRYQARRSGMDGTLKPGSYDLATGMPYDLVLERLAAGPPVVTVNVTIPEGFTAKQVAERFAAQAGVSAEELMALVTTGAGEFAADHPYLEGAYGGSLEGFLFPATYTVEPGVAAREVVEMMLDHFDNQIAGIDLAFAQSRGLDLVDVVIIASILEREAQLPEEFPLVSSVIYNRLAKPMRLQLCATVLYTLPEGTTSLTNADLEEDSPYNTYLHDGLPIGPISNPGLAALTAAAAPADTGYYYYVLTGEDGSQTFTKTYDEFLKAKQASAAIHGD